MFCSQRPRRPVPRLDHGRGFVGPPRGHVLRPWRRWGGDGPLRRRAAPLHACGRATHCRVRAEARRTRRHGMQGDLWRVGASTALGRTRHLAWHATADARCVSARALTLLDRTSRAPEVDLSGRPSMSRCTPRRAGGRFCGGARAASACSTSRRRDRSRRGSSNVAWTPRWSRDGRRLLLALRDADQGLLSPERPRAQGAPLRARPSWAPQSASAAAGWCARASALISAERPLSSVR